MVRADLFTLLSISQSIHYVQNWQQAKSIQKGVQELLKRNQHFDLPEVDAKLEGWTKILEDKCYNNDLTEVQDINMPRDFE